MHMRRCAFCGASSSRISSRSKRFRSVGICFVCSALVLYAVSGRRATTATTASRANGRVELLITTTPPALPVRPVDAATHKRLTGLYRFHQRTLERLHESSKYSHSETEEQSVARMEREYVRMMHRSNKRVSLDA
jgi:hypothetical protein